MYICIAYAEISSVSSSPYASQPGEAATFQKEISTHVPLTGIPMRQEAYQPEETEPSLQTGFIL